MSYPSLLWCELIIPDATAAKREIIEEGIAGKRNRGANLLFIAAGVRRKIEADGRKCVESERIAKNWDGRFSARGTASAELPSRNSR